MVLRKIYKRQYFTASVLATTGLLLLCTLGCRRNVPSHLPIHRVNIYDGGKPRISPAVIEAMRKNDRLVRGVSKYSDKANTAYMRGDFVTTEAILKREINTSLFQVTKSGKKIHLTGCVSQLAALYLELGRPRESIVLLQPLEDSSMAGTADEILLCAYAQLGDVHHALNYIPDDRFSINDIDYTVFGRHAFNEIDLRSARDLESFAWFWLAYHFPFLPKQQSHFYEINLKCLNRAIKLKPDFAAYRIAYVDNFPFKKSLSETGRVNQRIKLLRKAVRRSSKFMRYAAETRIKELQERLNPSKK